MRPYRGYENELQDICRHVGVLKVIISTMETRAIHLRTKIINRHTNNLEKLQNKYTFWEMLKLWWELRRL